MTKVDARTMRAIMAPRILSSWSAYRLNPGWWTTAYGGGGMSDGHDMAGLMGKRELYESKHRSHIVLKGAVRQMMVGDGGGGGKIMKGGRRRRRWWWC